LLAQQHLQQPSRARSSQIQQQHTGSALVQQLPMLQGSRTTSKHVCAAAAGDSSTPVGTTLSASLEQLTATCDVFYRFTRPHTMLGTFVSIVSVSIMAMQSFTWTSAAVAGLVQALVPALLMNVAIVGINQLYDVEIDKVNKPYLPLASGELSMQQGGLLSRGYGDFGHSLYHVAFRHAFQGAAVQVVRGQQCKTCECKCEQHSQVCAHQEWTRC
jgi:hypothetical protein